MARKVIYGSNTLDVEDNTLTVKEIQASMAEIFPELKNADATVEGDNIIFKVKAGTKGMARKVVYGSNTLDVEDDSLTVKEIQASMAEIFPELKNADASVEGDNIVFKVKAGTKGMARKVVYGSNTLDVEDDSLSVKEIQASMAEIFPELKNADATVEGDNIVFKVKAGTKGMARKVIYGSNTLDVEDDSLSVKEIQASMSEIFPELKNADASVEGDNIVFKVKAGTKGMARKVVYGSNTLDVEDDSLTVKEIQASMAEIFPELKNADATVEGDNIVFKVKAGTKGARFATFTVRFQ